jgi:YD repeat-containing protein
MPFLKSLGNIQFIFNHLLLCAVFIGANHSALAAEQVLEYEYNALGRLVVVNDTKNGNRNYQYDKAGNRTNVTVGTSSSAASSTPAQAPICYATRPWDSIKTTACAQQCPNN